MKITYTCIGDYLLPDIILRESPREITAPLGRYGRMRRAFLREHCSIQYNTLLLSEQLFSHLRDMDEAAAHRIATINDREIAYEIILSELVCD